MGRPNEPRRVAVMLDLQWPYKRHADVFAGTQKYAESQNWQTIIDEFAHDSLPARRGRAVPYDGVIARATQPLAKRAAKLGVPVVNVWASSPARHLVPGVFPDSTLSGRLCAEHLLARGFRLFATLTSPRNVAHRHELREFTRLIDEAGFPCRGELITQNPWRNLAGWRETERAIEQWMTAWEPPIGVYVGQEGIGRMVAQACDRRGWRVPADVAIIAGQNEETLCEHPRPSLTSVEMGFERVGYEAAKLLDRLMAGEPPPSDPVLLPPEGLVVRDSTDFFAVDDELVASALQFIAANSHRRIGPESVAQTTVSKVYGVISIRYRCGRCGQPNALQCPQRAAASAVGANPGASGVAAGRLNKHIQSLIQKDLETIRTADPIEFYEHHHASGERCLACGFLEVWQREKYERTILWAMRCAIILSTVVIASAGLGITKLVLENLLGIDNKLFLLVPLLGLYVPGFFLTYYVGASFRKRLREEFSESGAAGSGETPSELTLEFTQERIPDSDAFIPFMQKVIAEATGRAGASKAAVTPKPTDE
eukprot:g8267.t1